MYKIVHNTPHVVYWFYDKDGRLLYVGVTNSFQERIMQHKQKSPWFASVYRQKTRLFPNRAVALAAEKRAIVNDKPMHNIVHSSRR